MKDINNLILNFYHKFLNKDLSLDEFKEFRHYVNMMQDDELVDLVRNEWGQFVPTSTMPSDKKASVKQKLNFYIEHDSKRVGFKKISWLAIVASFILLISTTLFLTNTYKKESAHMAVVVERGNKAMITLPDDTKVWLNSNSSIEYNEDGGQSRQLNLRGEAFFKVSKNEKKPFIVYMEDLEIEVLGTSFNAKVRDMSHVIETSLVEGRIKIKSDALNQDHYLNPGEKAIYDKKLKLITVAKTDNILETAWMYNKLQFSSERFDDILLRLEDWYGYTILNQCPEISDDLITGTFKEEKIDNALKVLLLQYKNMQYSKQRDTIIISKK